jgi:hypothetical protein
LETALVPLLASVFLGGCSVGVPDPAAPRPVESTPVLATPTITPGYDAEAVAARDLPLAAGGTLAPGVPVGISDGLGKAPGWTTVKQDVAGEDQFQKADGCLVAAKVRHNQDALARGDDRESTIALFQYLDAAIVPEYLQTGELGWGEGQDGPAHRAEVMVLEQKAPPAGKATAVMARLFATAGSSVYISVSCPDAASLGAARADVSRHLPLLPPSN